MFASVPGRTQRPLSCQLPPKAPGTRAWQVCRTSPVPSAATALVLGSSYSFPAAIGPPEPRHTGHEAWGGRSGNETIQNKWSISLTATKTRTLLPGLH